MKSRVAGGGGEHVRDGTACEQISNELSLMYTAVAHQKDVCLSPIAIRLVHVSEELLKEIVLRELIVDPGRESENCPACAEEAHE